LNAHNSTKPILIAVVITALVAALGTLLFLAGDVFLLIFLGLLFAAFLAHSSKWVSKYTKIPYGWSLGLVVTALVALSVGTAVGFGFAIERQIDESADEIDKAVLYLRESIDERPIVKSMVTRLPLVGDWLKSGDDEQQANNGGAKTDKSEENKNENSGGEKASNEKENGSESKAKPNTNVISTFSKSAAEWVVKVFATTFGVLANFGLIFFVGLFVATNPGLYRDGFCQLLPPSIREKGGQVCTDMADAMWRWLLGRFGAMAITGIGVGGMLAVLGVPLPFTMAIVTALLTFIPNIGGIMALGLALLLAAPQGGSVVLTVFVGYCVLQLLESNVVTPLIQQRQVSIPPALLLSFQLLMGVLAGILGVLVATPLLAALMVFVKQVYIQEILEAGGGSDTDGNSENRSES